jgi:hypothetical protein
MNSSMRTRLFICSAVFSSALLGCSQERHFSQPNSGMEPTVLEGEKFVVDTTAYRRGAVSRGDVVVLKHDGLLILKRVIAISDDAVEGRDFPSNPERQTSERRLRSTHWKKFNF